MTWLALTLVLLAAFIHASWNLLVKRAEGGMAFTWLFSGLATIFYLPLAVGVFILQQPHIGCIELVFLAGTVILHTAYFLLLTLGYRMGDLSLVYPLARCTGPLLSVAAAIAFLGERPTVIALAGTVAITVGVFILIGSLKKLLRSDASRAASYAFLAGTFIASYTLLDKYTVSILLIPPILLCYTSNLGRAVLLAPFAFYNWNQIHIEWIEHRRAVLGVAILAPLSYILFLTALVFSPVSYVAPAREISILIGTFMGTRLLVEGHMLRRFIGASIMMFGLVSLALG